MKLVTVVVLLLLAVSLGAQTSNVGSNAAGNAFDELRPIDAPERHQRAGNGIVVQNSLLYKVP